MGIQDISEYGPLAQLGERQVRNLEVRGSIPLWSTNKKVSFVYQTKETFLSAAFLRNEMRTSCVMQASPVMHAFGA